MHVYLHLSPEPSSFLPTTYRMSPNLDISYHAWNSMHCFPAPPSLLQQSRSHHPQSCPSQKPEIQLVTTSPGLCRTCPGFALTAPYPGKRLHPGKLGQLASWSQQERCPLPYTASCRPPILSTAAPFRISVCSTSLCSLQQVRARLLSFLTCVVTVVSHPSHCSHFHPVTHCPHCNQRDLSKEQILLRERARTCTHACALKLKPFGGPLCPWGNTQIPRLDVACEALSSPDSWLTLCPHFSLLSSSLSLAEFVLFTRPCSLLPPSLCSLGPSSVPCTCRCSVAIYQWRHGAAPGLRDGAPSSSPGSSLPSSVAFRLPRPFSKLQFSYLQTERFGLMTTGFHLWHYDDVFLHFLLIILSKKG